MKFKSIYIVYNPKNVVGHKYYTLEESRRLVQSAVPMAFKSYDEARNAIKRTYNFYRKIRKLGTDSDNNDGHVYSASNPLSSVTPKSTNEVDSQMVKTSQNYQTAVKDEFFPFGSLEILRIAVPVDDTVTKIQPSRLTPEAEKIFSNTVDLLNNLAKDYEYLKLKSDLIFDGKFDRKAYNRKTFFKSLTKPFVWLNRKIKEL